MLHRCNRSTLLLLCLIWGLGGCASNIPRAKSIEVTLPAPELGALEVDPDDRARYEEAVKLLEGGELADARSALERLERDAAYIPGVHLNLALIHYRTEDYDEARRKLDEALELSPRNAIAHNLNGTLLRKEGRFEDAEIAYTKALKIAPDYAAAHFNLAVLFDIYLQYWIDAKDHYRRYLKLTGSSDKRVESWIEDLEVRIQRAGG